MNFHMRSANPDYLAERRAEALDWVTPGSGSTETQRELAWQFLKAVGVADKPRENYAPCDVEAG